MGKIKLLNQETINQIAAGEVIDRPASVVKELIENAIDADATAITVEIKDGGVSLIRITDNGAGIENTEIPTAFLRHATSKISKAEDLTEINSLGFRGEALSSIAAVSMVELISKTKEGLTGTRYVINGGIEEEISDVGVPKGTTFIVKNLFYNTPARRKFLKSNSTEAGYIGTIVEKIALSHPEISIKYIVNNKNKLFTPGKGNLKENIYNIYGKDVTDNILELSNDHPNIKINGYIGKPIISRGNRNYETYFINGRYIKSSVVYNAIEDGYKSYIMHHNYPFAVLNIQVNNDIYDVNVHPSKMEIRFQNTTEIYDEIYKTISKALEKKEYIPKIELSPTKEIIEEKKISIPEPFETNRFQYIKEEPKVEYIKEPEQITLFEEKFLVKESVPDHKVIGQVFNTYWLVEFKNELFIIDQHAAHEKVLYEKILKEDKINTSQMLNPPIVITLSESEVDLLIKNIDSFKELGFEIEHFGWKGISDSWCS